MATNQLLPFANGDTANVIDFQEWNNLDARKTGFGSGIASSKQFNFILAQGGAAGYTIGQFVADNTNANATINATELYANFKQAISNYVPNAIADLSIKTAKLGDKSVTTAKIADGAVTLPKLNNTVYATASDATVGTTVSDRLLSPAIAKLLINAILTNTLTGYAPFGGRVLPGTLVAWAGRTVPSGYLLCNGATIRRSQYPELAAVLASVPAFRGNGSTTVTLPNLMGRVLEGTTDASQVGVYMEAGLPNITGATKLDTNISGAGVAFAASGALSTRSVTDSLSYSVYSPSKTSNTYGELAFSASRANGVYGKSSTVQSASMRAFFIIKS